LGEAGATVYITARTLKEGSDAYPGSLETTAKQIEALGGRAVAVQCDHRNDAEVKAVFSRIQDEHGHLDVLVNSVWGGYDRLRRAWPEPMQGEPDDANYVPGYTWEDPFWKQPLSPWDEMFVTGVRSTYISSVFAATLMAERGTGLIVNASTMEDANLVYSAAHITVDYLTRGMAGQLRPYGVAVVSLYPGMVIPKEDGVAGSESPLFVGRAVAALAADASVLDKSGATLPTKTLAREYGFTDTDGTRPE
jgi:NAD(P)-dependent dehydrogenase (short-subunit alcohol dehydrogenase family)